jgi:hypothetical protein
LFTALTAGLLATAQPGPTPPTEVPGTSQPGEPEASGQTPPVATAAEALDRASAAYEFGDIEMMIGLSRMVAEGLLTGDDDQRAEALRLLGIGLYLSGRLGGAERAFVDLIRLRPRTTLNPSITRPEVVAFFRDVRRRNEPKKHLALAFLPPLGQFQNDTPVRGWIFAGLEVATFGAALTTRLVLEDWVDANGLCKGGNDPASCNRLKLFNVISVAALAATWTAGVIDALIGLRRPTDLLVEPRLSLTVLPNGAAVRVPF